MKFGVVFGKTNNNYTAYVPDLPGCVATGDTLEDTRQGIHDAIELHLKGMRDDGLAIPQPQSLLDYVEVSSAKS